MNRHHPLKDNFCDEYGKPLKSTIVQDYNRHMGYVDKSDCMTVTQSADTSGNDKKVVSLCFWPSDFEVLSFSPLVVQNYPIKTGLPWPGT
jgi:hypothetical protein